MAKIRIASDPDKDQKPFAHLEPLVDALIGAGNEFVGPGKFYLDRDGWRSDLRRPIDFDLLEERFQIPKSIIFSREDDAILDELAWIEIKGSVTWWDNPEHVVH